MCIKEKIEYFPNPRIKTIFLKLQVYILINVIFLRKLGEPLKI